MFSGKELLSKTIGYVFLLMATTGSCATKKNIQETILSASGTIFCDGLIRGTGLHIDKSSRKHSIIITAAHVLYDDSSENLFEKCSYRPNNMRLQAVSFAELSKHGYSPHDRNKIKQSEADIVFVALTRNLHQPVFHLSEERPKLKDVKSSEGLSVIAYDNIKNRIEISAECGLVRETSFISNLLVFHNCPTGPGSSGAPIIVINQVKFIGIHGGTLLIRKENLTSKHTKNIYRLRQGRIIDENVLAVFEQFRSGLL